MSASNMVDRLQNSRFIRLQIICNLITLLLISLYSITPTDEKNDNDQTTSHSYFLMILNHKKKLLKVSIVSSMFATAVVGIKVVWDPIINSQSPNVDSA